MAATLTQPGVEVIQEIRTVSPTVVTPTLVPCIVGVAKQVIEVLVSNGTGNALNPDAVIDLPAEFVAKAAPGNPAKYTGLDGLLFSFSANNGVAIDVTLSDPLASGLTPSSVVSQFNKVFADLAISSVVAELVGTTQWRLRTVGVGEFQSIAINSSSAASVLTAFGVGAGRTYFGISAYNQLEIRIPATSYPDPRGNIEELSLQPETARVWLATEAGGVGLLELKRNEAFLRNGVVEDAARILGNVNITTLTYPGDVTGLVLNLKVGSATATTQTYTVASPGNAAALIAALEANFTGVAFSQSGNFLLVQTDETGADAYLQVLAGTLATAVGLAVSTDVGESISAVDDGNGDVVTPILEFAQEDFTLSPTQAILTASQAPTTPGAGTTLIVTDGQQTQTITFAGTENSIGLVVTAVGNVVGPAAGGRITPSSSGGALRLTHSHFGDESFIRIIGGTALAALDGGGTPTIFAGAQARGVPFKPLPGDELYIDGLFYANIVQVAPAGVATRLKIDRQVPISTAIGTRFYIQAKSLPAGGSASRPYPNLAVDGAGNLVLKHSFLRDPFGAVIGVKAPIYLSYSAVRKDVTALAANKGLLRFDSTTSLEAAMSPLSTSNPLALATFYSLINAPQAEVTALGVDEVSADEPFGTLESFTRAAEFLENYEVYAIALLTHSTLVAQVFNTHVSAMSLPENKGERIVLWNPDVPTRRIDQLIASGVQGDAISSTVFDTKAASLTTKVNNAGINPSGTIPTTEGLYLDIAGDANKYSIQSISGSTVTIRTSFASGDNDDLFYSTTALVPSQVIETTFAIRVRGAELSVGGVIDKTATAETIQALGQSFFNRRFWMTYPAKCASTVEGVEVEIDGFYMNAAIAGMIGQQPPQQSFTNFPITGFTRVIGSNDTYGPRHLDIMAAGGAYIIQQLAASGPLSARHALTTDLTSVETRTDSVTKVVDFVSKFMRKALRTYIGRFNISQAFLDSLGSVIQGLIGVLIEASVLNGATFESIIQDEDNPDTVLVRIKLDVPLPCNYIRLTLQI